MPVNPYENLTATACLRTDDARKGRYGQSAGFVVAYAEGAKGAMAPSNGCAKNGGEARKKCSQ